MLENKKYGMICSSDIKSGLVTKNSTSAQAFNNFTGIFSSDLATLVGGPQQTTGILAVTARATGTDTIEITFANVTTVLLTPASGIYTVLVTH